MAEHGGHGGGGVIRELLAVFGFGVDTKALKDGENELGEFVEKVKGIGTALAGAFLAKEIFEFAEHGTQAIMAIRNQALQLGISAESVQEFGHAAAAVGISSDGLINSMGRLQVAQQSAAKGSGEQAAAFQSLGVSVRDSNGHFKDVDQLMTDVAEGMAKTQDPSKRAANAVALFGRSGRELLPLFAKGPEGLAELREEFHKLGGGYTKEAIKAAEDYHGQLDNLELSLTSLKGKILEKLLPILGKIVDVGTKIVTWFRNMTKDSYLVESALGVLGAAAVVFGAQMLVAFAPLLGITAIVAALILLIDDFVTMLEGGDSEIGELIDKIWGKDAHLETVKGLSDAWNDVKKAFIDMWPYVKKVWDAFVWVKDNVAVVSGAFGDVLAETVNAFKTNGQSVSGSGAGAAPFSAPLMSSVPTGAGGWSPISFEQTIEAAPGMDEKQLAKFAGEHAQKAVREVMKQDRRAAAATFQRKTAQ